MSVNDDEDDDRPAWFQPPLRGAAAVGGVAVAFRNGSHLLPADGPDTWTLITGWTAASRSPARRGQPVAGSGLAAAPCAGNAGPRQPSADNDVFERAGWGPAGELRKTDEARSRCNPVVNKAEIDHPTAYNGDDAETGKPTVN